MTAAGGWLTTTRGAAGIMLLAGLVYANCLGGGFLLDDEEIYLNDPAMRAQTVRSAFSRTPPVFLPHHKGFYYYRPVTILAHSWLLRIFGAEPFALHLVSVALHAAAGILVFLLLAEMAGLRVAWLAAALFVVHPLHVEAVAWMAALPELLAGLLILLSLYCLGRTLRISDCGLRIADFVPARNPKSEIRNPKFFWLALACLVAALAMLTKETAAVQPLLAAMLVGWAAWPCFLTAGGIVVLRYLMLGSATAYLPPRPFWAQVYLMASALVHYARKTVWPWPLASEYNLRQPLAVWVMAAVALIVLVWLAQRWPPARLGMLLFFVALAPAVAASLVLPGMRQAQDRYAYLAVLGLAFLIALLARGRAATGAVLGILILWSALSIRATGYWRDPEALWSQTLRVTPLSRNAVLGLGEWYYSTRRFADAERVYRQGLAYRPNDPDIRASRQAALKALRELNH
jgi:hypothetical protein